MWSFNVLFTTANNWKEEMCDIIFLYTCSAKISKSSDVNLFIAWKKLVIRFLFYIFIVSLVLFPSKYSYYFFGLLYRIKLSWVGIAWDYKWWAVSVLVLSHGASEKSRDPVPAFSGSDPPWFRLHAKIWFIN